MIFISLFAALLAGALVSVQTGSNTQLKEVLEEPLTAVILSSSTGVLLLILLAVFLRVPAPPLPKFAGAPWSAFVGGLCGAVYGVTMVLAARRLGSATLTAGVITGQLICSLFLDRFALLGFEWRPIGPGRLLGCVLLLAGTFLISRQ